MNPAKNFFCIFLLSSLAVNAEGIQENFSVVEDRHVGESIGDVAGWYAVPDGGAVVSSGDWMTGGQSLVLLAGYPISEAVRELPSKIDPLYLEVWMRPVFGKRPELSGIDAEGARLRFLAQDGLGSILVGDDSEASLISEFAFSMQESGLAAHWIRVALELDRSAGEWSLSVNGAVILENVRGSRQSFPGEVVFFGAPDTPVYVDALRVSGEAFSEFTKESHDGEETESRVDNDSIRDDGTKIATIDGETSSRSPENTFDEALVAETVDTVYVNNAEGDDKLDGRAAAPEGAGRGPVASLHAALARVNDGGTIVIYEGAIPYVGELGALNGKSVTLRTVGNVRVHSGRES